MLDFNLTIAFEKRSDDHYILRGKIGEEVYSTAYRAVPTFAQVGLFAGNCVVRYLTRDWSDLGSNA